MLLPGYFISLLNRKPVIPLQKAAMPARDIAHAGSFDAIRIAEGDFLIRTG
jgi:hypothetical protein